MVQRLPLSFPFIIQWIQKEFVFWQKSAFDWTKKCAFIIVVVGKRAYFFFRFVVKSWNIFKESWYYHAMGAGIIYFILNKLLDYAQTHTYFETTNLAFAFRFYFAWNEEKQNCWKLCRRRPLHFVWHERQCTRLCLFSILVYIQFTVDSPFSIHAHKRCY